MGWASYIEDIQKFRDDVAHFRAQLTESESGGDDSSSIQLDAKARIASHLRTIDGIIATVDEYLKIATDPQLDAAKELKDARAKFELLSSENTGLKRMITKLEKQLTQERMLTKSERKKRKKADRAVERLAKEDFARAVDAYPPSIDGKK